MYSPESVSVRSLFQSSFRVQVAIVPALSTIKHLSVTIRINFVRLQYSLINVKQKFQF
ncbi:hypothetical protein [Kamptonema sp. PCC 6506]|uniref:hypothetical protein n=1 Tax=Kamptonema sp. PCC 6506 TaxID=272129 RepID=UPI0001DAC40A|nr:hypothetical protein [Kamptonema sp. PCC 6506]CBN56083.1 hypothetical protein OSCI_2750010 [Kamptonema sp. PCC 6506]